MATDNRSPSGNAGFDPYYRWLGIPPAEQPPHHYRLLGLVLFENDSEVIALAAERQISHVRRFQGGPNSRESQTLLNELAAAEVCLSNPTKKAAYDAALKATFAPPKISTPAAGVPAVAPPGPPLPPGAFAPTPAAPPGYYPPPQYPTGSVPAAGWQTVAGGPPAGYGPPLGMPTLPSGAPPQLPPVISNPNLNAPTWTQPPPIQPSADVLADIPPPRLPGKRSLTVNGQQLLIGIAVALVFIAVAVVSLRSWFSDSTVTPTEKPIALENNPPPKIDEPPPEKPPEKPPQVTPTPPDDVTPPTPNPVPPTPPDPPITPTPMPTPVDPPVTPPVVVENPAPTPTPSPPTAPTKLPVPPESEQVSARVLFDEAWGSDVAAAKTDDGKAFLAEKFLNFLETEGSGDKAPKPVERYVILNQSRQLAMTAGRLRLALLIVQRMTQDFDLSPLDARTFVINEFSKKNLTAEGQKELGEVSTGLAEEAIAARQYDAAVTLLNAAAAAARKGNQTELVKQITLRLKDLQDVRERRGKFDAAQQALAAAPDDPAGNRAVGEYYCFEERNWGQALPHLAKCDDFSLKALATQDLTNPTTADEQIELGDRWWDCKVGAEGDTQSPFRARALYWYQTALASTSGLAKLKLEQRIRGLEKAGQAGTPPALRAGTAAADVRDLQRRWAQFLKTTPTKANSIGLNLTLVPGGEFLMGASTGDTTAQENERPSHSVAITKPFFLSVNEVTVAQFQQFVAAASHKTDGENDLGSVFYPRRDGEQEQSLGNWLRDWDQKQRPKAGPPGAPKTPRRRSYVTWKTLPFTQQNTAPVVAVSWYDAKAFCDWLSKKEKAKYRLPTEAEWEFACRAGSNTPFSNIDRVEELPKIANVADATLRKLIPGITSAKGSDPFAYTAPTGRLAANPLGLFDMHGNAAEWCADRFDDGYYGRSPAENPPGPNQGNERVIRGGSWADYPVDCRVSARGHAPPNDRGPHVGFRVVLEP